MFGAFLLLAAVAGCGKTPQAPAAKQGEAAPIRAAEETGPAWFPEVTAQLGLADTPDAWPDGRYKTTEITPGGVGLFDYDNDGDLDIYQVRHAPPDEFPAAVETPSPDRLYQQQADGKFVDVTAQAGLGDDGYGHGVAMGDVDNDGDVDLYVTNYTQDRFYSNNGDGTFSDRTAEAGFSGAFWSSSTGFFDYDRDGDLDLYVCRFAKFDPERKCPAPDGVLDYCGPHLFDGVSDALYRNNGDGTFTDVTAPAGIKLANRAWGVLFADISGDGWLDVYVANDEEPAQLWVNRHDGTFVDEAVVRGIAVSGLGNPEAGMGVCVGDADGNGTLDLFKTHIQGEKNTLYLGGSRGLYADKSAYSKMASVSLPMTGWGCGFLDYDHDGDLDLAVANGRVSRQRPWPGSALSSFWKHYGEPNMLFQNDGTARFAHVSRRAGGFTARAEVTRGLALGDLDNDGDVDLATNTVGNTLRVYRNEVLKKGRWLVVRAMAGKRDAYGAVVTVAMGEKRISRIADPAYSYLSSNDPRAHFGLGAAEKIDSVVVQWPDGSRERFAGGGVDRIVIVRQGEGESAR